MSISTARSSRSKSTGSSEPPKHGRPWSGCCFPRGESSITRVCHWQRHTVRMATTLNSASQGCVGIRRHPRREQIDGSEPGLFRGDQERGAAGAQISPSIRLNDALLTAQTPPVTSPNHEALQCYNIARQATLVTRWHVHEILLPVIVISFWTTSIPTWSSLPSRRWSMWLRTRMKTVTRCGYSESLSPP